MATATLLPNAKQQFFDANGVPLALGTVYFYIPGTTTPKNTWQDSGQVTLNTNPVVLDAAGEAIIYGGGVYRQVVKDCLGNTIWDQLTQDVLGLLAAANGSSLVGFQQGGAGATPRTVQDKLREVQVSVLDFAGISGSDITVPLQAAVAYLVTLGGGTIYIPQGAWDLSQTININNNNIKIVGAGGQWIHDLGTTNVSATSLTWTGAAGGLMFSISAVAGIGNQRIEGCGLRDMALFANGLADVGLRIVSHNSGTFTGLYFGEFLQYGIWTICLVTGVTLGEAADVQWNHFEQIVTRNWFGGANGIGWRLDGSSNADTGNNLFVDCAAYYKNQPGLLLVCEDNNTFIRFSTASPTLTGIGVDAFGTGPSTVADANTFINYSGGQVLLRGTESGYAAGSVRNVFIALDSGNSTQFPTLGTGSKCWASNEEGNVIGEQQVNLVVSDTIAGATFGRTNIPSSYAMYVVGTASAGILMSAGGAPTYSTDVLGTVWRTRRSDGGGVGQEEFFDQVNSLDSFAVNSVKVVGQQITGYGTPTGQVKTTNFPGATATLLQTSEMVAQLITDLKTHGLLGA